MNEQTIQLINQIAEKIGTKAEHLYAALIRQAYISAITDCVAFTIVLTLAFIWVKLHIKFTKPIKGNKFKESAYGKYKESIIIPMCLSAILIVAALSYYISNIGSTISGFINPDYFVIQKLTGH